MMDSHEKPKKKMGFGYFLLRCCFALFVPFVFVSCVFLTVLLLDVLVGILSSLNAVSVPCQCKIVSSRVDLRSSKVCELGLLNYNAKNVFYPSEKRKFRCHYDYYWASVFKVEYIDHSGQAQMAIAEAPNEALPPECRPTFASAWLVKNKFEVNETYDCWYTLGVSKLSIYHEDFFNCQAKNPSTFEMLRRYSILSTRMLWSWFSDNGRADYWKWEAIAGMVIGFSTSLITITMGRCLLHMKSHIFRIFSLRMHSLAVYANHLRQACLVVAYFSFVSWLAIQYGRRLGLQDIVSAH